MWKLFVLFTLCLTTVTCTNLLERVLSAQAQKRENSDKGIITSDPFLETTHFWPFAEPGESKDSAYKSILTPDLMTGANAILMNGATIIKDDVFDYSLDTHHDGSYVIVGDFNGTCFNDPESCTLGGMTIYFWLKVKNDDFNGNQDQYILSSGGQSKKSRGFAFLNFHGEWVFVLSTEDRQWKLVLKKSALKFNEWMQITIVWEREMSDKGSDKDDDKGDKLTLYLNGDEVKSTNGVKAERPDKQFTIFTIGRPNNAVNSQFMMPLNMAYVALWDKPLKKDEIDKAFQNIKDEKEIQQRRRRTFAKKHMIYPPYQQQRRAINPARPRSSW